MPLNLSCLCQHGPVTAVILQLNHLINTVHAVCPHGTLPKTNESSGEFRLTSSMSCSSLKKLYPSSLKCGREVQGVFINYILYVKGETSISHGLTNLLANSWSVNCASVGTLPLRNSSASVPSRPSDPPACERGTVIINLPIHYSCRYVGQRALTHLFFAPAEGELEELKAKHWYSFMESMHTTLRFGSCIKSEKLNKKR